MKTVDGPATVIAVNAVARNSGLILLWGPLKITFSGGGRAPQRTLFWARSTPGLLNSPPSVGLPHPKM